MLGTDFAADPHPNGLTLMFSFPLTSIERFSVDFAWNLNPEVQIPRSLLFFPVTWFLNLKIPRSLH